MKIELTGNYEAWILYEIEAGTFATPEEAVRHAIDETKLAALRKTIAESIAQGGSHSAEDVKAYIKARLDEKSRNRKAS